MTVEMEIRPVENIDTDEAMANANFLDSLKPLLVAARVVGLYRDCGKWYIAFSAVSVILMLLSLLRIVAGMLNEEPGLSAMYILLTSALIIWLQPLCTALIFYNHNIRGTISSIIHKLSVLVGDNNFYCSARAKTWLIKVLIMLCIMDLVSAIFGLLVGYFGNKQLLYIVAYPGGNGNIAVDIVMTLINVSFGIYQIVPWLFIFILISVMKHLFKDIKDEAQTAVSDNTLTTETLGKLRQRYIDLCDMVEDADRLMAPCVAALFIIAPVAIIFSTYGVLFVTLDEGSDPKMWYGPMIAWIGSTFALFGVIAVPAAMLHQEVQRTI